MKRLLAILLLLSLAGTANAWKYKSDFHYFTIKGLDDSTGVFNIDDSHDYTTLFMVGNRNEQVYLMAFRMDSLMDKRLHYNYFLQADTIAFSMLKDYSYISERKRKMGSIVERIYENADGKQAKGVCIYAQGCAYYLVQFNLSTQDNLLIDNIVHHFRSPFRGGFKCAVSILSDRILKDRDTAECGRLNTLVPFLLWFLWTALLLWLTIWLLHQLLIAELGLAALLALPVLLFLFAILALHDSMYIWMMGFKGFGIVLYELVVFLKVLFDA